MKTALSNSMLYKDRKVHPLICQYRHRGKVELWFYPTLPMPYSPTHCNLALDGAQGHIPATLSLWKSPITHCKGGWMGLRASLDGVGEEKISCPYPDLNPGLPSPYRITMQTMLSWPTHKDIRHLNNIWTRF